MAVLGIVDPLGMVDPNSSIWSQHQLLDEVLPSLLQS